MRAGCRNQGSRSAHLLPTAQAHSQRTSRAEEARTSGLWLWRSLPPGQANMPAFSTLERASAPEFKVRWQTLPRKREGQDEPPPHENLSVHITDRIWHGVEGVRFPTGNGNDMGRSGFYSPGLLGLLLGYFERERVLAFTYLEERLIRSLRRHVDAKRKVSTLVCALM
jgi:hypothetical protein